MRMPVDAGFAGIAVQALLLVLYRLAQALIAPSVRALPKA